MTITVTIPEYDCDGGCATHCPFWGRLCALGLDAGHDEDGLVPSKKCPGPGEYRLVEHERRPDGRREV